HWLQLDELQAGRTYGVLVTTLGGLVNYRLGDSIEVLSARPLTFRVAGRDADEISLSGEHLTAEQLDRAFESAMAGAGGRGDYGVWAAEGRPNRLVWAIAEPRPRAHFVDADDRGLIARLDSALIRANAVYGDGRRHDVCYGAPAIEWVPAQIFAAYRDRNLDRGQFKPRRIFTNRQAFERDVVQGS